MTAALAGGVILLVLGLAVFGLGDRQKDPWVHSGGLILALAGFFVLFSSLLWKADGSSPLLSTLLIFGAAGVFRLMGWFEPGPPNG